MVVASCSRNKPRALGAPARLSSRASLERRQRVSSTFLAAVFNHRLFWSFFCRMRANRGTCSAPGYVRYRRPRTSLRRISSSALGLRLKSRANTACRSSCGKRCAATTLSRAPGRENKARRPLNLKVAAIPKHRPVPGETATAVDICPFIRILWIYRKTCFRWFGRVHNLRHSCSSEFVVRGEFIVWWVTLNTYSAVLRGVLSLCVGVHHFRVYHKMSWAPTSQTSAGIG